jgi:peptide/nickel transport system substrate-binding protein
VRQGSLTDFAVPGQRQDPQVAWSYLDGLVRIDSATGTPAPSLARSWHWTDDGLTLTFQLEEHVSWHDGTPFTAEDARFTHLVYRDDYRSVTAGQTSLVVDVVALDDTTLEITFSEPDGAWVFNVASLPVMPAHQYRSTWEANPIGERSLEAIDFGKMLPVGTGPWVMKEVAAHGVILTRNDAYFGTPPHADALELWPVEDPAERIALWREGMLHAVGHVNPQVVEDLLQEDGFLIAQDAPRSLFAALNFYNPTRIDPIMWVDMRLREAVSLALDRERYADEIWDGFLNHELPGLINYSWVDTGSAQNPTQDLERARQQLRQAGWADADGNGIRDSPAGDALVLTVIVQDTVEPAVLETLRAIDTDLRRVEAALAIEVLPRDAFVSRWTEDRAWDLIVYDLPLYPAFASFDLVGSAWNIAANAGGWNPGGYWNPAVDDALEAYFAAVTEKQMAAALADLQRGLIDDPFAIWLGQPQTLTLLSRNVRGFVPNPLWPTLDTRLMWLDQSE